MCCLIEVGSSTSCKLLKPTYTHTDFRMIHIKVSHMVIWFCKSALFCNLLRSDVVLANIKHYLVGMKNFEEGNLSVQILRKMHILFVYEKGELHNLHSTLAYWCFYSLWARLK